MSATRPPIPPTPTPDDYAADGERPLIQDGPDPFALFHDWLAEATDHEPNDANAMSLATVDENGMPDVRIVLLKDVSPDGFTFYTNHESAKGRQLAATGKAALCFHWKSLGRQVRVRGSVTMVPAADSDAYFAQRARDSQIGAWASDQSRPLEGREVLTARIEARAAEFAGQDVPRPPHWGGYSLHPETLEFWQAQAFRLHDRVLYTRQTAGGAWTRLRLNP